MRTKALSLLALPAFLAPLAAYAHEVYVLTPEEIAEAAQTPSWSEPAAILGNLSSFGFWAFIGALLVFVVFGISIIRPVERRLAPVFARLRPYAVLVGRITIGLSFLASAYHQATYGPELSLAANFGALAPVVTAAMVVIGLAVLFGFYVRTAAIAGLALFAVGIAQHGLYMLTYATYPGELLLLLILGGHHGTSRHDAPSLAKRLAPYSFLILRVGFGVSLLYASLYAKIVHNNLALAVASLPLAGHASSLASVLGFEPHFLVVGAAIVEATIATFFILGIEIRFTSLFLLFWLTLSLLYFGESVWPHVVLIGIPLAFICWGYDRYSLEGYFFKRGAREPVL